MDIKLAEVQQYLAEVEFDALAGKFVAACLLQIHLNKEIFCASLFVRYIYYSITKQRSQSNPISWV